MEMQRRCRFADYNESTARYICSEIGDDCLLILPNEEYCYEIYDDGPIHFDKLDASAGIRIKDGQREGTSLDAETAASIFTENLGLTAVRYAELASGGMMMSKQEKTDYEAKRMAVVALSENDALKTANADQAAKLDEAQRRIRELETELCKLKKMLRCCRAGVERDEGDAAQPVLMPAT